MRALKETDEIIISCRPGLSASINHAIILALDAQILKEWKRRYKLGTLGSPL